MCIQPTGRRGGGRRQQPDRRIPGESHACGLWRASSEYDEDWQHSLLLRTENKFQKRRSGSCQVQELNMTPSRLELHTDS